MNLINIFVCPTSNCSQSLVGHGWFEALILVSLLVGLGCHTVARVAILLPGWPYCCQGGHTVARVGVGPLRFFYVPIKEMRSIFLC